MVSGVTAENKAARRHRLRWTYVVPIAMALLASCASPPTILPGTIEPINVPPHHSPIYTNQPKIELSLAHESAQDWDESTRVEVDTYGVDGNGASCSDHISSHFTEKTSDQSRNHITPFDVVVSSNGEDGLCSVSVSTRECIGTNCSAFQDTPYTVDVVFDTKPPQVVVDANVPGVIQGSATNSSPLSEASVSYAGQDSTLATSPLDSTGRFSIAFIPEVGPKNVTLTIVDAAGNPGTATVAQDYEFNAGLNITSMQLDGKQYNLAQLSQVAGRQIQDGDLFVGMKLPEGVDPNTVSISGEQGNWRNFGFKSTFTCDKMSQESYDVAFSCTLPSKSGDTAQLKFTFTDKYGYQFDMYYPQQSFFSVDTREMTLGEMALYITERAVAILAGLSIVGLSAAAEINRRRYNKTYQSAAQLALGGNMTKAFKEIDESSFIMNGQRNRMKSQIRGLVEEQKRTRLVEEHKNLVTKLYVFPMAYHDYKDAPTIYHEQLKEAIDNLNRVLQLNFDTTYLQDVRGRSDAEAIYEKFTQALDRWMELNFENPAKETNNDWKAMEHRWGEHLPEIESVMHSLYILQTRQTHNMLWSRLKKGTEKSKNNIKTIGLLYAYNQGILFRSGKMRQEAYTSLITHNEMQIEDVVSTLMKWGSTGVGEFVSAIHDGGERVRAEKHFKSFIGRS